MPTRDESYLLDIYDSGRFTEEFVAGIDREFFLGDRMRQSAVIRELAIIGEAVKKISMDFRAAHPEIPWADMAGMRDILVHDYRGSQPESRLVCGDQIGPRADRGAGAADSAGRRP